MAIKNTSGIETYYKWSVFILYLLLLAITSWRHELWGDELHSWNIAKASTGLPELFSNIRYEGHPPLWYLLLFGLSRLTHQLWAIQVLHFIIASVAIGILQFKSHFRMWQKILIVSGYFFMYEYTAFSRNYALAILLSFSLCALIVDHKSWAWWKYYTLLFLLANTHVLGLFLAISIQCYLLFYRDYQMELSERRPKHLVYALLLFLVPLYLVFPPNSSGLNIQFWIHLWSKDQLYAILQAPLKAFVSLPAWWNHHFWNTNALLELQKSVSAFKFINPLLSMGLILLVVYILRSHKGALFFFCLNLVLTFSFALVFPLTSSRYVGFIFIAFLISLWIAGEDVITDFFRMRLIAFLLVLQLPGSVVALAGDWKYPFSSLRGVSSMMSNITEGEEAITDYWCLNYVVPVIDKPIYCIGLNQKRAFLLWTGQLTAAQKNPRLYTEELNNYFASRQTINKVYLFTNNSRDELQNRDHDLFSNFDLELVAGKTGAIEKNSNIYLFEVKKLH